MCGLVPLYASLSVLFFEANMQKFRCSFLLLMIVVTILSLSCPGDAQVDRSGLTGTVTDPVRPLRSTCASPGHERDRIVTTIMRRRNEQRNFCMLASKNKTLSDA